MMKEWLLLRNKLTDQHGFTLVELLASLVIFTILVSTMYGFFVQASSNTKGSQNKTVGVNLARNAIVYLQKKEFELYSEHLDGETRPYTMGYCFATDATCTGALNVSGDAFFNTVFASLYPDSGDLASAQDVWDHVFQPNINGIDYRINVSFLEIDESDREAGRYLEQEMTETEDEFSKRKEELAGKLNELIIPLVVEVAWQDQGGRIHRTNVEGYLRNGKAYLDEE